MNSSASDRKRETLSNHLSKLPQSGFRTRSVLGFGLLAECLQPSLWISTHLVKQYWNKEHANHPSKATSGGKQRRPAWKVSQITNTNTNGKCSQRNCKRCCFPWEKWLHTKAFMTHEFIKVAISAADFWLNFIMPKLLKFKKFLYNVGGKLSPNIENVNTCIQKEKNRILQLCLF